MGRLWRSTFVRKKAGSPTYEKKGTDSVKKAAAL